MSSFPEWCLLCASMAWDNACGHFPGHPIPPHAKKRKGGAA